MNADTDEIVENCFKQKRQLNATRTLQNKS